MIPEELLQYIGKQSTPQVMEVEKGAIKRYAQAIEDDNPLYLDEEYARNSRYGTIIAPSGFFGWPAKPVPPQEAGMRELMAAMPRAGYPGLFNGGTEYEFYLPVRAGDILVSTAKISDIYERVSKSGNKMIFAVSETSCLNQNGDLVAKWRLTLIFRQL